MVPYGDSVVAVTVIRVLLFVLHVCILKECEGEGNAGGGWMRCGFGECGACGWLMWFRYCVWSS